MHRKGSRKAHSTTPLKGAESLAKKKPGQGKLQQKNGVHKVRRTIAIIITARKGLTLETRLTMTTTTKTGNMLLSQDRTTLLRLLVHNLNFILLLVNGLSNEAGTSLSALHMKSGSS
jgi:hypothetical protein